MEKISRTDRVGKVPKLPASGWCLPPEELSLGNHDVHVWRVDLRLEASYVYRLKQILSEDEQARANRFYFQKDRDWFIVAHGLLRSILGRYLEAAPSYLKFNYGPYGKPSLASESGVHDIRFNMSHSGGLALFALARGLELGVDLEQLRPDFAAREIAEKFFSPREVATLFGLPSNTQLEAFFNCWTRKEAYIKARGEGLTIPLADFDVSLAPGEPARLLYTRSGPKETSRWTLTHLNLPDRDFVAALAVEGHNWHLKCWQWL